MTISIRDRTTEELIRREAERSGRSITATVRATFEAQEHSRRQAVEEKRRRLDDFLKDLHARRRPGVTPWTNEEFDALMYGDEEHEQ